MDKLQMPLGLWNLIHNMEGETGFPVDQETRRKRRERDEKEKEQRQKTDVEQGAERLGGPAPWMLPPTRDMTVTLPLSTGEDDLGLPPCPKTMYKELGETAMTWLAAHYN